MSGIGVVATLTVAEGKNAEFEAIFADLAAAVRANEPGNLFYTLTRSRRGDTSDVMLDYVGYDLARLRAIYADKVAAAALPAAEAAALTAALEAGLTGYTYLDDGA